MRGNVFVAVAFQLKQSRQGGCGGALLLRLIGYHDEVDNKARLERRY